LKQGEKISNLENASQKILFIYLWLFAKGLWKEFTKVFAKTKHVVQAWSKNVKYKEINPWASYENLLVQFLVSFALTLCKLVQLCTSIFALVCVGINHQKGEIEREIGLHLFLIDFGDWIAQHK
jgi:hypothetical protein